MTDTNGNDTKTNIPEDAAQEPEASAGKPKDRPPIQASLLQFISGMTAQTLMHLGAMSNPMTGKTELDLINAKYSIDLLAILQEKTKGNLTDEEAEYFKTALYQLRMSYVQATERQEQKPESTSPAADKEENQTNSSDEK